MTAGIVILNYNDNASTITLADSIKDYGSLERVLIVDNCSSDNSYKVLSEHYEGSPKVEVLLSERNGGYSYGNNFGANYLIDKYNIDIILIANPDVLFDESVVIRMKEVFERHNEYAVLSAVMTRPDGTVDKAPYRDLFSYSHDLFDNSLLVRRMVYEKKHFLVDHSKSVQDVEVIQGSFFAIRADVFRRIKGLDDNIFLYYEEMILAKKLKDAGYKTGLLTNYTYLHNHSTSIMKSMKRIKIWRAVLKSKYYYQKNYNHINYAQMVLLKIGGGISTFEKIIIEVFRKL